MLGCTVPLRSLSLSHTRLPASVRVNKNPKKQKPHHTDRHARTKAHTHTYTQPLAISFHFCCCCYGWLRNLFASSHFSTSFSLHSCNLPIAAPLFTSHCKHLLRVCLEVFVCVLGVCVLMCCISKRGTGRKRVALFHPCTKHTHTHRNTHARSLYLLLMGVKALLLLPLASSFNSERDNPSGRCTGEDVGSTTPPCCCCCCPATNTKHVS